MEKFLNLAVNDLYKKSGNNLSDYIIIFPNKRAGVFFRKYLADIIDKPVWLPEIYSIQEYIVEITKMQIGNKINLLFDLYSVYRKQFKNADNFDDFYFWGEMLLNDFDDIDKYLANARDVFQNVSKLKSMDDYYSYLTKVQLEAIRSFWKSFEIPEISTQQKDFIKIWDKLFIIYEEFKALLETKSYAYEGLIFRKMAELAKKNEIILSDKKIALIGFNALNGCELELYKFLQRTEKGVFYWDYDNYYIDKEHHQASFFIRNYIKQFKNELSDDHFTSFSEPKSIEIISVSSQTGQAKVIPKLIEDMKYNDEMSNTAIVLADENMLLPVLYSIPESIEKLNVTMGYPVKNSLVFALFENLETLQKNKRKNSSKNEFYHKDIKILLADPLLQIPGKDKNLLLEKIKNENLVYLDPDKFTDNTFLKQIFGSVQSADEYLSYLSEIIKHVINNLNQGKENGENAYRQEFAYQIFLTLNNLRNFIEADETEISLKVFYRILKRLLNQLKAPFTGEPLSGLQIMGLLESRNLDFENVIILSANEGILPASSIKSSYIPYNLRRAFDLPLNTHYESIVAYHFYRLIQRAKKISILYSTNSDGFNSGEMSRFLYQLIYESGHNIKLKQAAGKLGFINISKIEIYHNKYIAKRLLRYHDPDEKAFLSPTALISFIECRLKFYFKHILGLKEKEKVIEDIDHRILGNLFHDVMQRIYSQFGDRLISSELLKVFIDNDNSIDKFLLESFSLVLFFDKKSLDHNSLNGKNLLLFNILKKYVINTLNYDSNQTPFKILGLEQNFENELQINLKNILVNVRLAGTIDRIDQKENAVKIIDYKTGGVDNLKVNEIESLFDRDLITKMKSIFQTFMYGFLYESELTEKLEIHPGLYFIQKMADKNYSHYIISNDKKIINYQDVKDKFTSELKKLLEEMFSEELVFNQTEDLKMCKLCSFSGICHRN